jgi:hypothetical protein
VGVWRLRAGRLMPPRELAILLVGAALVTLFAIVVSFNL